MSRTLLAAALLPTLAAGCATWKPPEPTPAAFRERAQTRERGGVRVSAALVTKQEAEQSFATKVVQSGIQPVWLEIENREREEYVLMPIVMDPDYFSPSEAAWKTRGLGERRSEEKMQYFLEQHVPITIAPGTTASGFVYTNFDPGAKAFSVALVGETQSRRFDYVLEVPGFQADYARIEPESHYERQEIRDLDLAGLRAWLEELPCCVLGGDRKTPGDPMNLVVVGDGNDVLATFVSRGWDLTETLTTGSALRTGFSSVFGSRYRTSPVSPLYVFDRPQDAALQKARATVDERNHLRLWLAPVSFAGSAVWVGQISRDIGVKLSSKTIVTHKIDPVVDEARFYVLQDIALSGYMDRAGYVKGVGFTSPEEPRYNFTLDPYFTDGLRVVLFLTDEAVGFDEIDWLEWEDPTAEAHRIRARSERPPR
jgi:hypothetical protein